MKYTTEIKQFGNENGTIFVSIPKLVKNNYNLTKKQKVQVIINPIIKQEIKNYRCKKCEHQFPSEEEIPYCPACDSESLGVIKNQ